MKKIRKVCFAISIVSTALVLTSCFSNHTDVSLYDVHVSYKNVNANYGDLALLDDEKIYFEFLSNIHVLDTQKDIVIGYKKAKTDGTLFCADRNILYYKEETSKGVKITANTIEDNTVKTIYTEEKGGIPRLYLYCIKDGSLYIAGSSIDCMDIDSKQNRTTMSENANCISKFGIFTLYKDENYLYITKNDTVNSLLGIRNDVIINCGSSECSILSNDITSDTVYLLCGGNIYYDSNDSLDILTDLAPNDERLHYVSAFAEGTKNLYLITSTDSARTEKELYAVNKADGSVQSIYKPDADEYIVSVYPDYFIFYRDGTITKRFYDRQKQDQSVSLYNSGIKDVKLECTEKYLFSERKNTIHVIRLDTMDEVFQQAQP